MARLIRSSAALVVAFAVLLAGAPAHAQGRTEIHWWHAMTDQLGEALVTLAKQFNESQNEYEVKPSTRARTRRRSPPPSRPIARRTRPTSCWSSRSARRP